MLRRVTPVASTRSGYRLNLVVPTVDAARTFGGIRTALDLFEAVGASTPERRIISLAGSAADADAAVHGYSVVGEGSDPAIPLQFAPLEHQGAQLAVRDEDVFIATFWTTAELVARIRHWRASPVAGTPLSAYIIQDYEPGFYPSSALSMLSGATYAHTDETIGVFNTSLLRDSFHRRGIGFPREFTFEPRILDRLRAAMSDPPTARVRTIVVYGRPGTPRNAFPAIVDGLRAWRATDPAAHRWTVVSVGQTHPQIDLGSGLTLTSLGKLDIGAYGALLRRSAIGISLMVSPHPSYPPLEMAHLGMLVLTNGFDGKDLSTWHSNIHSLDDISAEAIATELTASCRRFEADPVVGATGRALRPEFLATDVAFPFADELAAALRASVPGTPGLDQDGLVTGSVAGDPTRS